MSEEKPTRKYTSFDEYRRAFYPETLKGEQAAENDGKFGIRLARDAVRRLRQVLCADQ